MSVATGQQHGARIRHVLERAWEDREARAEVFAPNARTNAAACAGGRLPQIDQGDPAPDAGDPLETIIKSAEIIKRVFPDMSVRVEDEIETGDKVVIRWRMHGTHEGEFMGIKPSGKKVDVTGITIYRFENGKVVESWGEADLAGLAHQVGAPPHAIEHFMRHRTAR